MSDRHIDIPPPRRKVDAFAAPTTKRAAGGPRAATEGIAPVSSGRPKQTTKKRKARQASETPAPKATDAMVRVHTTLSPEVVEALSDRAESSGATHTEILADALVHHLDALTPPGEDDERAAYEALGFRPPRRTKRSRGRMAATFYMSTKARASLDNAAAQKRFESRSAFIDALLRRALAVA